MCSSKGDQEVLNGVDGFWCDFVTAHSGSVLICSPSKGRAQGVSQPWLCSFVPLGTRVSPSSRILLEWRCWSSCAWPGVPVLPFPSCQWLHLSLSLQGCSLISELIRKEKGEAQPAQTVPVGLWTHLKGWSEGEREEDSQLWAASLTCGCCECSCVWKC